MQDVPGEDAALSASARRGRLAARSRPGGSFEPVDAGESPIGLGGDRDGLILVPGSYDPAVPAPLLLVLHGATGNGRRQLDRMGETVRAAGAIIVAPDSRWRTWDVLRGGYGPDPRLIGPDVAFLDRVLDQVFARFNIDPSHIGLEGFSDGASYALSLGVANGDLFTHLLANSPGFVAPPVDDEGRIVQVGSPRIYLSHGTEDAVLPIDMCGRLYARALSQLGYDLTYREFVGPHTMPPEVLVEMLAWWLADYDPTGGGG